MAREPEVYAYRVDVRRGDDATAGTMRTAGDALTGASGQPATR
ncbi:hypothetical protein [Streptomyces achromogenes]